MEIGYLHAFNCYPPQSGGTVHAYQVTSHLMRRGHRIHALDHDRMPGFIPYPETQQGIDDLVSRVDVLYARPSTKPYMEYIHRARQRLSMPPPLLWEVNAPPETIAMAFQDAGPASLLVGGKRWLRRQRARLSQARQQAAFRRYAKDVTAALCVSKGVAAYARQELGIGDITVLPNGSDPELFRPGERDPGILPGHRHRIKVLWAGSSEYPWQGFSLIPRVAERMLAVDPDRTVLFVLLTQARYVEAHTRALPNLVVADEVPYMDVPRWMNAVDVCLCLYHPIDSWCRWGFYHSPLKLFDYMAAAKPIIASNLGQIGEVITHGETGLLTDNRTGEIVAHLRRLLADPDAAKAMGERARQRVLERYNWGSVAEETDRLLTRVVGASREATTRKAG